MLQNATRIYLGKRLLNVHDPQIRRHHWPIIGGVVLGYGAAVWTYIDLNPEV